MGIKKIARPMNNAKNIFVQWLKKNKATDIDEDKRLNNETGDEWDYYFVISGFIGESLYMVYFMIWNGIESIDYSDSENKYDKMSIEQFLQLIN